ncbi:hypothetical protein [Actinoallomurus iriomotensis]|uniref:Uncharacterized protein n=1 Tax=Actinoallomurus iriomotensis TaxID=478107 RepID=A0A9W6RVS1_9ACTN|nr:hypothetical protein [Actinoallomurus iriomotensis]GLY82815.1 hypothetical protein Airi02_007450 [Actinoallomurus iriomotensis]
MVWLTMISAHSGYVSALLGPLMVTGAGMGLIFGFGMVAATGTFGVAPRDAGVAPASIDTGQQLGGSIGIALLGTIAVGATSGNPAAAQSSPAPSGVFGAIACPLRQVGDRRG